jgi:hypothetical protein
MPDGDVKDHAPASQSQQRQRQRARSIRRQAMVVACRPACSATRACQWLVGAAEGRKEKKKKGGDE